MNRFRDAFTLNGVTYVVTVNDDWQVQFYAQAHDPALLGIAVDADDWNMPDTYMTHNTTGVTVNPVAVFRAVLNNLVGWVRANRPAYLFFACNDQKKYDLYMRLIVRTGLDDVYNVQFDGQYTYLAIR